MLSWTANISTKHRGQTSCAVTVQLICFLCICKKTTTVFLMMRLNIKAKTMFMKVILNIVFFFSRNSKANICLCIHAVSLMTDFHYIDFLAKCHKIVQHKKNRLPVAKKRRVRASLSAGEIDCLINESCLLMCGSTRWRSSLKESMSILRKFL